MNRSQGPLIGLVVLLVVLAPGCRLVDDEPSLWERVGLTIKPVTIPADAMQLEFAFVDRPTTDPDLGPALWDQLDRIGNRAPPVRAALAGNGLLVGQTGSAAPVALENLLSLTAVPSTGRSTAIQPGTPADRRRPLKGWRVFLRDGGDTEVQTLDQRFPHCELVMRQNGSTGTRAFRDARFVIRVTVTRLQDNWARLEFLPEVHHGSRHLRPTAADEGWQYRTRQNIVPLYSLLFTVDLSVGELVVISGDPLIERSVGRQFFLGTDPQADRQRVLVVRLANMQNTAGVFVPRPR